MATMNTFPPDVPRDLDEAHDAAEAAGQGLRAKVSNLADRVGETARDTYGRARDAVAEADPAGMAREGGGAALRAVERHPLLAFGLGALSVGLVAWSALRRPPAPRRGWESYVPDQGRLRGLWQDYGREAIQTGGGMLDRGGKWLQGQRAQSQDYGELLRDYADHGGRALARRAEREPIAALIGVGIAVYVIGSLLTSSSAAAEPAPRKRPAKR